MVFFGFARVSDDEVASEGRLGFSGANRFDTAQETFTIAPTTHPTQQGLRDVLQGKIKIRHTGLADRIDQSVGEIGRIEIQQSRAFHSG